MAKEIPFIAPIRITLASGGQGSGQFQNSANQEFRIHQILQKSDGDFDIIDMSNNASDQYSPASESTPLNGYVFPDMEVDTDSLRQLPQPLILEGQQILKFTLLDTSAGANVVDFALVGVLIQP